MDFSEINGNFIVDNIKSNVYFEIEFDSEKSIYNFMNKFYQHLANLVYNQMHDIEYCIWLVLEFIDSFFERIKHVFKEKLDKLDKNKIENIFKNRQPIFGFFLNLFSSKPTDNLKNENSVDFFFEELKYDFKMDLFFDNDQQFSTNLEASNLKHFKILFTVDFLKKELEKKSLCYYLFSRLNRLQFIRINQHYLDYMKFDGYQKLKIFFEPFNVPLNEIISNLFLPLFFSLVILFFIKLY